MLEPLPDAFLEDVGIRTRARVNGQDTILAL